MIDWTKRRKGWIDAINRQDGSVNVHVHQKAIAGAAAEAVTSGSLYTKVCSDHVAHARRAKGLANRI